MSSALPRQTTSLEGECPSVDDLARFIEKAAPPALTQRILAHLDDCETCRILLAATMQDTRGEADAPATLSFAPRTFPADEVVGGRYRIARLLSRGGMGEVYEAWDLQLGESIALKTIACTGLDNASLYVRIRKEVQLARKVTHQNVCRILEFGVHQQLFRDQSEVIPFFTMELLSGETLAEYFTRRGRVSTAELLPIVAQILRGLSAIHTAGIVHRDLKPENIFLLNEPEGQLRVVVMDFGLARIEDGRASLTGSSNPSMVGTPNYMAPEQSLGGAPTIAWDIFALGVILYRAVAGELPFKGTTAVALAMARIKERAPRLSSVVPDVEPWFEQIVARCLDREPARRYGNVAELERAFANRRPLELRNRTLRQVALAGFILVASAVATIMAFSRRGSNNTAENRNSVDHRSTLSPPSGLPSNGALLGQTPMPEPPSKAAFTEQKVEPGSSPAAPQIPKHVESVHHERASRSANTEATSRVRPATHGAPAVEPPSASSERGNDVAQQPLAPGEDEIVIPDFARRPKRVPASGEP